MLLLHGFECFSVAQIDLFCRGKKDLLSLTDILTEGRVGGVKNPSMSMERPAPKFPANIDAQTLAKKLIHEEVGVICCHYLFLFI